MASAVADESAAGGAGDGSDEATDSEDLGFVDLARRQGSADESRRMFQKLWTDADEIKVLQGFYEFTSRRGTTHANYQHDTGPFFDEIRPSLQFPFNKNQIVEKLRRLKKKYRNAASRIGSGRGFVFKSPHDRSTYEISRNIWSSSFKRKPKNQSFSLAIAPTSPSPLPQLQDLAAKAGQSAEEEAFRICLAPLLKDLVQFALDGATTARAAAPPAWLLPVFEASKEDHGCRRQRILELELCLKRMELLEETVRAALQKLRSMGS